MLYFFHVFTHFKQDISSRSQATSKQLAGKQRIWISTLPEECGDSWEFSQRCLPLWEFIMMWTVCAAAWGNKYVLCRVFQQITFLQAFRILCHGVICGIKKFDKNTFWILSIQLSNKSFSYCRLYSSIIPGYFRKQLHIFQPKLHKKVLYNVVDAILLGPNLLRPVNPESSNSRQFRPL